MPEHDTYDLDAAFSRLEQDVAGLSSPRGAGTVIATARRRRRMTIGGAVAGLALVVGAAVIGQGITSRDSSVAPAQLPPPAPFDAAALTAATQGWVAEWHSPTTVQTSLRGADAPRCLETLADDFDKPGGAGTDAAGGGVLVGQGGAISLATLAEWGGGHPDASRVAYTAVVASIDSCAQASSERVYTWDGAEARSWTLRSGHSSQHLWVARTDRAVGVLWAGGPARPVPDDIDQQVSTALVAGLQSPASFHQIPTSTSSAETSPSGASPSTVSDAAFARALTGWDSGWRQEGSPKSDTQIPCPGGWDSTSSSGSGGSLGANGDQEFGTFDTAAHAQAAFEQLRQAMADCAGSSYKVVQPIRGGGMQTFAASGAEVVWAVQQGRRVGVVTVPGGGTPPPVKVSVAVLIAIQSAMRN